MPTACRRTPWQAYACDNNRSRLPDFVRSSRTGSTPRNDRADDTAPPAMSPADRRAAAGYGSAAVPLDRAYSLPPGDGRRRQARRLRQGRTRVWRVEVGLLVMTTRGHGNEDYTHACCWSPSERFYFDFDDCMTSRSSYPYHPQLFAVWEKQHNPILYNDMPTSVKKEQLDRQTNSLFYFLPRDALQCKAGYCDRTSSVSLSVCDVGGSGSHRSEILETNCTDT